MCNKGGKKITVRTHFIVCVSFLDWDQKKKTKVNDDQFHFVQYAAKKNMSVLTRFLMMFALFFLAIKFDGSSFLCVCRSFVYVYVLIKIESDEGKNCFGFLIMSNASRQSPPKQVNKPTCLIFNCIVEWTVNNSLVNNNNEICQKKKNLHDRKPLRPEQAVPADELSQQNTLKQIHNLCGNEMSIALFFSSRFN